MTNGRDDLIGDTPLHAAALNSNPSVILALIEGGADPSARNEDDVTPRNAASCGGTQFQPFGDCGVDRRRCEPRRAQ